MVSVVRAEILNLHLSDKVGCIDNNGHRSLYYWILTISANKSFISGES